MWVIYCIVGLLAFLFFVIVMRNSEQENKENQIRNKMSELDLKLIQKEHDFKLKVQSAHQTAEEQMKLIENIKHTAIKDFPIIAEILADIQAQRDMAIEESLRRKKYRAIKAADEVKAIRYEKNELAKKYYSCKWELSYLKSLLPWIEDIEEEPIEPITKVINSSFNNKDNAGYWLTPDEYAQLSTAEKYQRALDRYYNRNKTNKEIGTDYERYIGYLYETKGYSVEYFGIEKGMEDLGRDLVCINDNEILIVQCKCWSNRKNKVIHEKHINQLYGTTIMYKLRHNHTGKIVKSVFISTVPCTNTAREFAEYLGVTFKQIPLEKYPMIKCNINKATKEKIYHLPFDQQYDKCSIKLGSGEFYAMTVKEAEEKGFRRAMKWHGK